MFKMDKCEIVSSLSHLDASIEKVVRYWDKAGTDGGGAYTAGVLMAVMSDSSYIVLDVVRGQWSAAKRERMIKLTAERDSGTHNNYSIWMEQEPGSGGKDVARMSIASLSKFNARADKVSGKGSKEHRAEPYSAQVEIGNVKILKGAWNQDFIDEHRLFPNGTYKDQVDAAAGAYTKLQTRRNKKNLAMESEKVTNWANFNG